MAVKTIADAINEAHNTGSEAIFEDNGQVYEFSPKGLKDYISGGSSGPSVDSVNGKTGSVILTPTDIGATATGNAVFIAVSQAAARAAIGAGTSSLTLGTTANTALKGDTVIPSGVSLVPTAGTDGQVLKVVSGVPAWAADTNTTYTVMSAAEATAGTATTGRVISAKVLADAILERASSYDDTALTQMIGLMQTEIETMQLEIETLQSGFTTLEGRVAALETA